MAFVHGLVRTQENGRKGWCAPVELGEAAPHYVSFVLPLDENGQFFRCYTCEVVNTHDGVKEIQPHELVKHGADSFVLRLAEFEIWFAARAISKDERLPYVGRLKHNDFKRLLTEIELEDPKKLDRLFEAEGTFVIGCEPFAHYEGIDEQAKMHSSG